MEDGRSQMGDGEFFVNVKVKVNEGGELGD